jgi:Sec-independent protein translocase protein TatA
MLNIGLIEILLIFFFFILLVKPEDIPTIFKNLGLFYRKLSRYFYNIKYEIDEINNEFSEVNIKKKRIKNEVSRSSKRIKK